MKTMSKSILGFLIIHLNVAQAAFQVSATNTLPVKECVSIVELLNRYEKAQCGSSTGPRGLCESMRSTLKYEDQYGLNGLPFRFTLKLKDQVNSEPIQSSELSDFDYSSYRFSWGRVQKIDHLTLANPSDAFKFLELLDARHFKLAFEAQGSEILLSTQSRVSACALTAGKVQLKLSGAVKISESQTYPELKERFLVSVKDMKAKLSELTPFDAGVQMGRAYEMAVRPMVQAGLIREPNRAGIQKLTQSLYRYLIESGDGEIEWTRTREINSAEMNVIIPRE